MTDVSEFNRLTLAAVLGDLPSWEHPPFAGSFLDRVAREMGITDMVGHVVAVPEGPGLGVTLSRERLDHCHRMFLDDGPMNKYHQPEQPETFVRLPLA